MGVGQEKLLVSSRDGGTDGNGGHPTHFDRMSITAQECLWIESVKFEGLH
jgi:hypothetical protein